MVKTVYFIFPSPQSESRVSRGEGSSAGPAAKTAALRIRGPAASHSFSEVTSPFSTLASLPHDLETVIFVMMTVTLRVF